MTGTWKPELRIWPKEKASKDWAVWCLLIITVNQLSQCVLEAGSKPAPCWHIQLTEQIYTSSHQSLHPWSNILWDSRGWILSDISQDPGLLTWGICEGKPLSLMSSWISRILDTVKTNNNKRVPGRG